MKNLKEKNHGEREIPLCHGDYKGFPGIRLTWSFSHSKGSPIFTSLIK